LPGDPQAIGISTARKSPSKIKGQTFYQAAEQTYSKFVTLTAVPEPTVVTFGGLGALLLLRRHRA
jgi:hypothetical protein